MNYASFSKQTSVCVHSEALILVQRLRSWPWAEKWFLINKWRTIARVLMTCTIYVIITAFFIILFLMKHRMTEACPDIVAVAQKSKKWRSGGHSPATTPQPVSSLSVRNDNSCISYKVLLNLQSIKRNRAVILWKAFDDYDEKIMFDPWFSWKYPWNCLDFFLEMSVKLCKRFYQLLAFLCSNFKLIGHIKF